MCLLTFDHDHVDIYGANGRLRQAFPFLQDVRDLPRRDAVVRLASERHQLPDGHSWRMYSWVEVGRKAGQWKGKKQTERDGRVRQRDREQDEQTDKGKKMQIEEAGFQVTGFLPQVEARGVMTSNDSTFVTHRNSTRHSDG